MEKYKLKESADGIREKIKKNRNLHRIALATMLSTAVILGVKHCESLEKKNKNIENTIDSNKYWKGEHRFSMAFTDDLPREKLSSGVEVIRDQGICFYIVKKGDNLYSIRNKLSKTEEFSYLKDESYAPQDGARNINSFNVPSTALKPGLFIPIPLAKEQRETSDQEFYRMSLDAIEELKSDSTYGPAIQKILSSVSKEQVAKVMCTYARSETAQDWKEFSDKIGSVTLHRWEPHMKSFSFSHYHILMEKNADRKTDGPGLKARKKLKFTEGQTYHPKNGGKLFLAYRIEKNKTLKNPLKLADIFRMKNQDVAKKFGKIYNGDPKYGEKLWANYQYFEKTLK